MENLFQRDDYLSIMVDNNNYKDNERLTVTLGELRKFKDYVLTWQDVDNETYRRKARGETTKSLRLERISSELTDEQREKVLNSILSYCYPYKLTYAFGSDTLTTFFSQLTGVEMSEEVFKEIMKDTNIRASKRKYRDENTQFYNFVMRDTPDVPPILRGKGLESWKYMYPDELRTQNK